LGLGVWVWGLGPIPNPQSPIPNPQSPIPIKIYIYKIINKLVKIIIKEKFNYKNKNFNH